MAGRGEERKSGSDGERQKQIDKERGVRKGNVEGEDG